MIINGDKLKGSCAQTEGVVQHLTHLLYVALQTGVIMQFDNHPALYDNTKLAGALSGKNASINGASWAVFPEVD